MKRHWEPEELIEHFILLPHEVNILPIDTTNAAAHNRLGFAILLKFFQLEARFPHHAGEVPKVVVNFIAQQLKIPGEIFCNYPWSGGVYKSHRAQIRNFAGFRWVTSQDKQDLKVWLIEKVLPLGPQFESLRDQVYQWFRHQKIEPPAPKELNRLINSATRTHENAFCQSIAEQLLTEVRTKMDDLLDTDHSLDADEGQYRQSDFNGLKMDPGRLGLKSLLREIDKLQQIREIKLPPNLFRDISPKLLQRLRRRASAEPARTLRRSPIAIRYTLIASFCHQRQQEITDNLVELLVQIIHRIRPFLSNGEILSAKAETPC